MLSDLSLATEKIESCGNFLGSRDANVLIGSDAFRNPLLWHLPLPTNSSDEMLAMILNYKKISWLVFFESLSKVSV